MFLVHYQNVQQNIFISLPIVTRHSSVDCFQFCVRESVREVNQIYPYARVNQPFQIEPIRM